MRLSTLISSHNKGQTLERSIRSAVNQSHPPCEVVVTEDCSSDNSRETLERLTAELPTLRVIEYPAKSADWMRDYVDHSASLAGDYVHLLAADDYALPGFYDAVARAVDAHPNIGVVMANVRSQARDGTTHGQSSFRFLPGHHFKDSDLFRWLSDASRENFPGGTATALSREALTWLRVNGAAGMGPWFDSVAYPAACWPFGVYHIAAVFGVFTLDQSNYGGDQRPAEQRAKERPGAEAFFNAPGVRALLPDELCERLLSRVKWP